MDLNENYLYDVCKLGDGELTCRYLTCDQKGFACGKLDPDIARTINARIAEGTFGAHGDHCHGLPPTQIIPWRREGGETMER